MKEPVINAIDMLINVIYSPDQDRLVEKFQELVETLITFVNEMQSAGYMVDLTKELTDIQNAFERKDYVVLADEILYRLKPQFELLELDNI